MISRAISEPLLWNGFQRKAKCVDESHRSAHNQDSLVRELIGVSVLSRMRHAVGETCFPLRKALDVRNVGCVVSAGCDYDGIEILLAMSLPHLS